MGRKYDRISTACDVVILAKLVRASSPLTATRLSEISGYRYESVADAVVRLEQWGIIRTLDGGYACADRQEALAWLYRNRPDLLPSPGVI